MQDNNSSYSGNNVVKFRKLNRSNQNNNQNHEKHPPLINLPEYTKIMVIVMIACHVILYGVAWHWGTETTENIFLRFGFVPAKWTGKLDFDFSAVLSLFLINFMHGGWMHLGINAATFVAFGAGIEKRIGGRHMLILFFASSIAAVFTHLAFSPFSYQPVVGASGGISGLFGAILIMMKYDAALYGTQQRILPTAMIWIAITIIFGVMGGPGGQSIAWIAHIGGFLAGLGLGAFFLKRK